MSALLASLLAKPLVAICAASLAWAPVAYVLPVGRVLEQWDASAGNRAAVRLDFTLSDGPPEWPSRLVIDVHPDLGTRVDAGEAGRWVLRGGELIAGSTPERPVWLPELELLVLSSRNALQAWLGFDLSRNRLARCGLSDCFVLGGPAELPEVWLDKDTFEVRLFASARGVITEYDEYRDYSRVRFPREIRILDGDRRVATLRLFELRAAPTMAAEDFSPAWVREPGR
jgi:hypothetical protein